MKRKNQFQRKIHLFLLSLLLSFCFFSKNSEAKIFKTSYISFEIPSNWSCSLTETEWVCKENKKKGQHEAIIVVVAKEKGPSDNLSAYQQYLKKPRLISTKRGKLTSKVKRVIPANISQTRWIDGLHLESEVKSHFTRYLVTTNNRLAILVGFTVHKDKYIKYSKLFTTAINSLKILSSESAFANYRPSAKRGSRKGVLGYGMKSSGNLGEEDEFGYDELSSSEEDMTLIYQILGALLLVGVILFFVFKRLKRN